MTLLHCVSAYPTPAAECNLSALESLNSAFDNEPSSMRIHFGWSDHSVSPAVIYRAVHRWNAGLIEFHLDLDGRGEEFASGHCWLPDEIGQVIQTVRCGFEADGNGQKTPPTSELPDREWRADPDDGLRPVMKTRAEWTATN